MSSGQRYSFGLSGAALLKARLINEGGLRGNLPEIALLITLGRNFHRELFF